MSTLEWNVMHINSNRQTDTKPITLKFISELKNIIENHLRIDNEPSFSV